MAASRREDLYESASASSRASAEVRTSYQKYWADDALRATVAECKGAGIGVSILTLVGAGGIELAEPHVERTARLIESLDLGAGDFVFLLDESEIGGSNAIIAGYPRLCGPAWLDQQTKFKRALAPLRRRGVKVLPYTWRSNGRRSASLAVDRDSRR